MKTYDKYKLLLIDEAKRYKKSRYTLSPEGLKRVKEYFYKQAKRLGLIKTLKNDGII